MVMPAAVPPEGEKPPVAGPDTATRAPASKEGTASGILLPPGADAPTRGRPFSRRTPFYWGLTGALGVAVAYVLLRAVLDVGSVLIYLGVALFLAVGLDPVVAWLTRRGIRRGLAVLVLVAAVALLVGGFVAAAVPPISHEASRLSANYPRYRNDILHGHGWLGSLVKRLHLTSYLEGQKATKLKLSIEGGALGAGKALLSAATATITTVVLTVYFLVALPSVKRLWLGLVPLSRRERARELTEETFARVGGFVLGNLLTSLVAGVGTYIWLAIFGVHYPFLLALFVALLDLVPVVGSTVGGIVVSLVALTRGLPIAIATAVFYLAYRFFEDYLLTPRVMGHTVRISPGLTIIATLIGGTLLGLIGALIAIPCAATVYLLVEEIALPRMNRS
jgi:predicted PurR-regulated permease PerM